MHELSFGQRIKKLRRDLGVTQDSLAEQVGYSVDTIRKVEAGSMRPSRQLAELLAIKLDIPGAERAAFVALARGVLPPRYDSNSLIGVFAEDAPQIFPNGPARSATSDNLPAQATSFVGREQEVAACLEIMNRPEVRLLTLTGPGGTGKTRLALRLAEEMSGGFSDHVFFVSLAAVSDADLVAVSIMETLGLTEVGNRTALEALKDFLREKHLLLVLDNFEQVAAAAPLLARLISGASRLKMLVTSRAVLRLSGEHVYLVPPLSLPARDTPSLPATMARYDSVGLFLQRASAAKPLFQITDENAGAIAEICMRLDGLPLAIELAAARIRLFSPSAMLTRISGRLGWLTGGPQDRDARQQTLRATIDWSYNLLDPIEQAAFARLSVFTGGFGLDAADSVASADFEAIASLADKSLLSEEARHFDGDETRFRMLESVREYALEKLADSRLDVEVKNLHARYFAEIAIKADAMARSPGPGQWVLMLDAEQENIRAALAWCLEGQGDHETGLKIAGALFWYWRCSSPAEGRTWLKKTATTSGPDSSPGLLGWCKAGAAFLTWLDYGREEARIGIMAAVDLLRRSSERLKLAHALGWLGMVESETGQYLQARAALDEALTIFNDLGQEWDRAMGLQYSGISEMQAWHSGGSSVVALRHLENSYKTFVSLGNDWSRAATIDALAWAMSATGEYRPAISLLSEGLQLARQEGSPFATAHALQTQAMIRQMHADYRGAIPLMQEALALHKVLGDQRAVAQLQHTLGYCLMATGELEPARVLCEESLILNTQLGEDTEACWAMRDLACVRRLAGEPVGALKLYEIALTTFEGPYSHWFHYVCLIDLVALLGASREPRLAALLFGAADALEKSIPDFSTPDQTLDFEGKLKSEGVAAAYAVLGPESYALAAREGREMPHEQALNLAITAVRRRLTDEGWSLD